MRRGVIAILAMPAMLSGSCFQRPSTLGAPCRSTDDCDGAFVCVSGTCQGFSEDMGTDSESDSGAGSTGPPPPACGDGVRDDPLPCPGEPGVIAAGGPTVLAVADLDGDGLPEIIGPGPAIYRPLQGTVALNPTPVPATSIAVLDMDGDGNRDVVTANDGSACATRWAGEGQGALGDAEEIWCALEPRAVATARVGGRDVLVAGHGGGASIQQGAEPVTLPPDGGPSPISGLCPGGLVGAGDDDVVGVTDADGGGAVVWRAEPDGYAPGQRFATGTIARACQITELDGDDAPDVLLTPDLDWIPGDQLGEASPQLRKLNPDRDGAATADWEGDGDTDLLVWSDGVPGLQLWIRESDGSYAPPFPLLENIEIQDGRLADITGDGTPDVVAAAGPLGLVWVPQAP